MPKHGTYAGWNQHRKDKTPTCLACKEAARQYQAARRAKSEAVRKYDKVDRKARARALQRLAALHPYQYANFYLEERSRLEADDA